MIAENWRSFLSLKPTLPGLMRYLSSVSAQAGLSALWFAGALPTKNYTRFMLIGRR